MEFYYLWSYPTVRWGWQSKKRWATTFDEALQQARFVNVSKGQPTTVYRRHCGADYKCSSNEGQLLHCPKCGN